MNLPLRHEEAALITAALGILDLVLFKSRYPVDVQNEISKRCVELIERIERIRQEQGVYDFQSPESETEA